jgi:hypothetical protein
MRETGASDVRQPEEAADAEWAKTEIAKDSHPQAQKTPQAHAA